LAYLEETSELGINVYAVTEDGSMGINGMVTDGARQFLSGIRKSADLAKIRAFACGPVLMLKAVSELAAQFNIQGEIAMEALMPCGFGICMGCVVKIANRCSKCGYSFKRVCQDGPIFNASDIIWD
jgi:dihydroorotate dehydrogenase electron transfer subunit